MTRRSGEIKVGRRAIFQDGKNARKKKKHNLTGLYDTIGQSSDEQRTYVKTAVMPTLFCFPGTIHKQASILALDVPRRLQPIPFHLTVSIVLYIPRLLPFYFHT